MILTGRHRFGMVSLSPPGVPVEFSMDERAAVNAAFRGVPSRTELERFFFLNDADRELIEDKRRAHDRPGFAAQLTTARHLGVFRVGFGGEFDVRTGPGELVFKDASTSRVVLERGDKQPE